MQHLFSMLLQVRWAFIVSSVIITLVVQQIKGHLLVQVFQQGTGGPRDSLHTKALCHLESIDLLSENEEDEVEVGSSTVKGATSKLLVQDLE